MDAKHKNQAKILRDMGSADAADWLLANFKTDDAWDIPRLFLHANLAKQDVRKIATHVMNDSVHAHDTFYRAFVSRMGALGFLTFLDGVPFTSERDRSLMHYHLRGIFSRKDDPETQAAWATYQETLDGKASTAKDLST